MKLYIELVLADNLAINYILLYLVSKLAASSPKTWRILLSCLLGAVYSALYLLPQLSALRPVWCKLLLSLAMVALAFGVKKRFLRHLGIFYITTFVLGGAMLGLFYFTGIGSIDGGIILLNGFPLRIAIVAAIACMLGLTAYKKRLSSRIRFEMLVCIDIEGSKTLNALLDSGHSLKDPHSGSPVFVADFSSIREILPPQLTTRITPPAAHEMLACLAGSPWASQACLIPYATLEKQKGLMLALRPKKLTVYDGSHWRTVPDAYVGISPGHLPKHDFSILVPACIAQK
ncbi:MAG: sigma-E processing peptidase SpoIIGA [Christensenellales bacterium]|jgi:stage II sporulation protein GA (sporulation sigma-E factor processing peptidase)